MPLEIRSPKSCAGNPRLAEQDKSELKVVENCTPRSHRGNKPWGSNQQRFRCDILHIEHFPACIYKCQYIGLADYFGDLFEGNPAPRQQLPLVHTPHSTQSETFSMAEHERWWSDRLEERYWLEATDRRDIGADLKAPVADARGADNWRYSLFREANLGDIVYHYDARSNAITSWSRIAGVSQSRQIIWAARGSYARERGATQREVDGYVVGLDTHTQLQQPLTLTRLREEKSKVERIVSSVRGASRKPIYFPFELSQRALRPLQGYAFKLPSAFVSAFPELNDPTPPAAESNELWTDAEMAKCLDVYAHMLSAPTVGKRPSGSKHVRELSTQLPGRSPGAITRRMQSISTVLQKSGQQWASRFPPREGVGSLVEARLLSMIEDRLPTANAKELERRTRSVRVRLAATALVPPKGSMVVTVETTNATRFRRLASVQGWVLCRAKQACEGCCSSAPFLTDDDLPFLEVHHIRPLAEGGPDTVDNAVALCPNCHRRLHHSKDRLAFRAAILARLHFLTDYPIHAVHAVEVLVVSPQVKLDSDRD
jgi:5-methylcytosine-specific restriction endonuclease McrA